MKVTILPEVLEYLEELVIILYEKQYFGSFETSGGYVAELINDINTNLSTKQHKPAPPHFDRYGKGMEYASFRKNRHTAWYVFFRVYRVNGEIICQVRYITNNHVAAQYLGD
jgi:hypothetical protein